MGHKYSYLYISAKKFEVVLLQENRSNFDLNKNVLGHKYSYLYISAKKFEVALLQENRSNFDLNKNDIKI